MIKSLKHKLIYSEKIPFLILILGLGLGFTINCAETSDEKIIFVSQRSGNPDIYIMDTSGADMKQITDNPLPELYPAASPDGQSFLYVTPIGENETLEIMMGFYDSLQTHIQLTSDFYDEISPHWSPDGKKIIFQRKVNGVNSVWIMDTSGEIQNPLNTGTANSYDPDWQKSGKWITFAASDINSTEPISQIYKIKSDGSIVTRLTSSNSSKSNPIWSLNGNDIYFLEKVGPNKLKHVIKKVNAEGGNILTLVEFDEIIFNPKFSNSKNRLIYSIGGVNINSEIYLYDLLSGLEVKITNNSFADYMPNWVK